MKVQVKCTGVMCGNIMIPAGVQDTESLGLKDEDVKALIKRTADIEVYNGKKSSKKDEGTADAGQADGADAGTDPDPVDPKAYDDITGQEMIDFLAKKGVHHEFTKDKKKELYPVYTGHFNDPDVA